MIEYYNIMFFVYMPARVAWGIFFCFIIKIKNVYSVLLYIKMIKYGVARVSYFHIIQISNCGDDKILPYMPIRYNIYPISRIFVYNNLDLFIL